MAKSSSDLYFSTVLFPFLRLNLGFFKKWASYCMQIMFYYLINLGTWLKSDFFVGSITYIYEYEIYVNEAI